MLEVDFISSNNGRYIEIITYCENIIFIRAPRSVILGSHLGPLAVIKIFNPALIRCLLFIDKLVWGLETAVDGSCPIDFGYTRTDKVHLKVPLPLSRVCGHDSLYTELSSLGMFHLSLVTSLTHVRRFFISDTIKA